MTLLTHAAETGGGPTGFGWASFVTFVVGIAGLTYMLGQFLKALHARRTESKQNSGPGRGNGAGSSDGMQTTAS